LEKTVRVLIAEDHRLVREALRALLAAESGVQVVAEAEDGRTAVRLAAELSPDVVVMDINMPDLNGIDATRQVRAGGVGPKVIALSAHSDRRYSSEMLKAGATGFVVKEAAFEDLAHAIRTVVQNKLYLSPAVSDGMVQDLRHGETNGTAFTVFGQLSPREREVLQLLAEGKAMKEVAAHLQISGKTVETHRRNIMQKLNIDSMAELTKYAIREGLTSLHR
jgi:two-component system, NarL family, response regulator NreC